jgi:ABC-type transporter Mla subunit MlaD
MASTPSEIKAGAFVAGTLALLFVMVFAVGDCGKFMRGSQHREVLFSTVSGLQPNSAVNYAGVEIGRVSETTIVEVKDDILAKIPPVNPDNLDRLPLTYDESDRLKALALPAAIVKKIEEQVAAGKISKARANELKEEERNAIIDKEARRLIGPNPKRGLPGRKMILLVLEILQGTDFSFREDDVVSLATTVMGDSSVEISPGSGTDLPEGMALLGDDSNLFSQLSDSMREIKTLLARVSGLVGDEEKAAIKKAFANIENASANVSEATSTVKGMVEKSEQPLVDAIRNLQQGMAEARKTIEELRPRLSSVADKSGAMLDEGNKTMKTANTLLAESKPKVLKLMDEATAAASKATAALKEMESTLYDAGEAIDENRPSIRRAMADMRESSRNFKEMTARLKRAPWLLLKKPRARNQQIVLLESSSRSLAAATQDLAVTIEFMNKVAADPETAERLGGEKAEALLKEIRAIYDEMKGQKQDIEVQVRELKRKTGGKYIEESREKADQEK